MRIGEKRIEKIDQKIYKFMSIFGPKNQTFLHGPFRELGTNGLFQVTITAIGVLFQPSDHSRLLNWSNKKNMFFDQKLYNFKFTDEMDRNLSP